jgi:hypothetical protein
VTIQSTFVRTRGRTRQSRTPSLDELWARADEQDDQGNLRFAFRLFMQPRKPVTETQNQVGYYIEFGDRHPVN